MYKVNTQAEHVPLLSTFQGRKAVFLWGVVLFGVSTLVSSLMRNQIAFFVFRGLMGVGLGMIAASSAGKIPLYLQSAGF
jgi:MFS family permease